MSASKFRRAAIAGSLACAMLSVDETRATLSKLSGSINVNFFCHVTPVFDAARRELFLQRFRKGRAGHQRHLALRGEPAQQDGDVVASYDILTLVAKKG